MVGNTVDTPLSADKAWDGLVVVGDVRLVAVGAGAGVVQGALLESALLENISIAVLTASHWFGEANPPQICGQEFVSARHHD